MACCRSAVVEGVGTCGFDPGVAHELGDQHKVVTISHESGPKTVTGVLVLAYSTVVSAVRSPAGW